MDDSARVKSLLESLELHQAELNAQNDALQATLKALAHINAELERAGRRYQDLYDLAPTPYVTLDVSRSIVQLNAAAAKLLSRPAAQLVGARTFDIAKEAVFVDGDPTQLCQLILNLVTNAAEAIGKQDSAINVSLAHDDKSVTLTVSGTGPGMSDETHRRMFAIELPQTTSVSSRTTPAPVVIPPQLTGTLLLVDDMPDVVDGLASLLELLGFKAIVSYDGHDAVERLRANPDGFDAAIIDLSMPRMDGFASAAAFREIRPDLPIALTSGCDEQPFGGDRVFQALLSKPYTTADLMLVLAQLLVERQRQPAADPAAGAD